MSKAHIFSNWMQISSTDVSGSGLPLCCLHFHTQARVVYSALLISPVTLCGMVSRQFHTLETCSTQYLTQRRAVLCSHRVCTREDYKLLQTTCVCVCVCARECTVCMCVPVCVLCVRLCVCVWMYCMHGVCLCVFCVCASVCVRVNVLYACVCLCVFCACACVCVCIKACKCVPVCVFCVHLCACVCACMNVHHPITLLCDVLHWLLYWYSKQPLYS